MMKYQITISSNSSIAKHIQVASRMKADIEAGHLKVGTKLPSINVFSKSHRIARDTVEKAYNVLKKEGYIISFPGKGNYVAREQDKKIRILMILNKMSSYKKEVYEAFIDTLGESAKVDMQIHHYSVSLFNEIIEESRGKYHYYVVMPHFFHDTAAETYLKILNEIPSSSLVVLDKKVQLKEEIINVFQDFELDILEKLQLKREVLTKYDTIILVFPKDSHHPIEIIAGVKAFCVTENKKFELIANSNLINPLKGVVYITLTENELATLVKKIRNTALILGTDVGILSFNETVFKELLGISVVSTNFSAMGNTAATMILNKEFKQVRNEFSFIQRHSL
jgi:DNA-binding transcriptional regulator YhcF (GntR family)